MIQVASSRASEMLSCNIPVTVHLFFHAHTQCVDPRLGYEPNVGLHEDLTRSQGQTKRTESGFFASDSAAD